jgi:double-stranded uracil-DNA glycosylase
MPSIHGFPPIADANATRLVVGSMPGRASLDARQYYAHPRNSFWRIVEATLGVAADLPYDARCVGLRGCGVALWDVLKECAREGSLDSSIVESSLVANDFASFLDAHPRIAAIYFNGAKAEHSYRKHVLPALPSALAAITTRRLPSTSPANASYSFERKLALWTAIREQA